MSTLKDEFGFEERAFQKKNSIFDFLKKRKSKAVENNNLIQNNDLIQNDNLIQNNDLIENDLNKTVIDQDIFEQRSFHRNHKNKRRILKKGEKTFLGTLFKLALGSALLFTAALFTVIILFYLHIESGLPKISNLSDYRPPTITNIFSDDGTKIGEFYKERRIVIPLSEMPENLINAFVSAEDSRFREHVGIDIISIVRAFIKNMRAGSIVQGGSTITQQVTKSFLLTPERTYKRKIKEAILAYRIDKTFSKDDILFLYLNQIYLGHGAYGVEAAAENYFGKHAKELNLAECSILAGLPQAPSRYSPFKSPELAKQRQAYVLKRMEEEGYISDDEMNQAAALELDIQPRKNWFIENVPWYTEYVRRYVIDKYGEDAIYNQGLNIYTAVNINFQKIAENAVKNGLEELENRHGYGGPLKNVSSFGIDSFSRKIAASLPKSGILEKNKIYKGVITEVDPADNIADVRVGNNIGIIDFSGTVWADFKKESDNSKSSNNEDNSEEKNKNNSSKKVLKIGDVVLLKALDILQNLNTAKNSDENLNAAKNNNDIKKYNGIEEQDIKENGNNAAANQELVNNIKKSTKYKSIKNGWKFKLEVEPEVEGALISIEAETGHVKAMIGGRNYQSSQFNRAIQSKRQPGSSFKPIIYAAALDKGYTASSIIIDSPIAFKDGSNKIWKPQNYSETFYGPTRLREALVKSRNVVTVKIVQDIGIDYVIEYAGKLGITSPIERNLSISLGSCGISLLELVKAYTVFSNLGYLVEPTFITKIVDRDNNIIEQSLSKKEKVIDMSTAYIMTNMMESVVQSGTATRAKELGRPAACKTGTTNDMNDALFIGYTPQYTTGVWVGFDKKKSLGKGESGARSAIPIWLDYMKGALEGKAVMPFNVPEGVVFHNVDPNTGLLSDSEYGVIKECFKEGVLPTRRVSAAPIEEDENGGYKEAPITETEDLFKSDI